MRIQATDGKWYEIPDQTTPAPTPSVGVMSKGTNDVATIIMGVILAVVATPQFASWASRAFGGDPAMQQQLKDLQRQIEEQKRNNDPRPQPAEKKVAAELLPIDDPLPMPIHELAEHAQDDLSNRVLKERIDKLTVDLADARKDLEAMKQAKANAPKGVEISDTLGVSQAAACSSAPGMNRLFQRMRR